MKAFRNRVKLLIWGKWHLRKINIIVFMLWQKMRNFSSLAAVSNNLTFILPVDKCKISTGNVSSPSARPPATMTLLTWPLCCFGIATQVWLCLPTPSRVPNSTHVWRLQSYRHIPPENLSSVWNQCWINAILSAAVVIISGKSNIENMWNNIFQGQARGYGDMDISLDNTYLIFGRTTGGQHFQLENLQRYLKNYFASFKL